MGDKNGKNVPGRVISSGDDEMDGASGGAIGGGDANHNPGVNNGPEKEQNPGAMDNRPSLAQNNNRPNITDESNNPEGVRERDAINNRPSVGGGPAGGYMEDLNNRPRVGGGPTGGLNNYNDDFNTRPRLEDINSGGRQRINGVFYDEYNNRPRNGDLFSDTNKDNNVNNSANQFNNNRERFEEYDRQYNRPSNTYYRPSETQYDRYSNKDGNFLSSASNNDRYDRDGIHGGARPKTSDEYNRPRQSIFEDNPRQLRYIFEDNPRQRQGFFEGRRQRTYDRPDP